jgi:hypothetical protein
LCFTDLADDLIPGKTYRDNNQTVQGFVFRVSSGVCFNLPVFNYFMLLFTFIRCSPFITGRTFILRISFLLLGTNADPSNS